VHTTRQRLAPQTASTLNAVIAGLAMIAGLALLSAPPRAVTPPEPLPTVPLSCIGTPPPIAQPTARATGTPTQAQPPPAATSKAVSALSPPSHTTTPSATPTAQPSVTPTPTATPLHAPADADPTRIQAEAIGLDAPVVTVGTREAEIDGQTVLVWEVADDAAGFHQGSARPGHSGNTVITGHNNVAGEVFRELHRLSPGDRVLLWVNDRPYAYEVDVSHRIEISGASPDRVADALSWIEPTDDQRLTLVTCWPYWGNTHRTIVVAYPVAP